jgi:hypothetical protein
VACENENSKLKIGKDYAKLRIVTFTSHSSRYLFYNGADPLPSHAPIPGLRPQASE